MKKLTTEFLWVLIVLLGIAYLLFSYVTRNMEEKKKVSPAPQEKIQELEPSRNPSSKGIS